MAASSVVSALLGLVFMASGGVKLTRIIPQAYEFQAGKFVEWARVFPLVPLGYTPDPQIYMTCIGCVEACLGACLLLGPRSVSRLACLGLMLIMTGAAQTLIFNHEYAMLPSPVIFFAALYWLHGNLAPKPKED